MSDSLLTRTCHLAQTFLRSVNDRPVRATATAAELASALGGTLPDDPEDPHNVIEHLAAAAESGLLASQGPRCFGFVIGGSTPSAMAADWLVSAWDQNAALHVMSPAIAAIEDVTARWLLELLGLPRDASVGFVTGATMANVTALAAARHEMLRRVGWDVEAKGLQGAPLIRVLAGAEAHSSIRQAARLVGLGAGTIVPIDADDQGRMGPDALGAALAGTSDPTIVCAQAGNVNTGACDPLGNLAAIAHGHGAWLHVDGAFGLWAAAASGRRHLLAGIDLADSWATDCHKWLNVPYDSGVVVVAHPAAHRASMSQTAAYLIRATDEQRDGMDWTPEASRRARGVPIYAALRTFGRSGIDALIERCCRAASHMASILDREAGVTILNEVVLNQVLARFGLPDGTNVSPAVIEYVQAEGVCWAGGTRWNGEPAMRISVSNWKTTDEDIDRSAASILRCFRSIAGEDIGL
jgi:glutamate/tyrosine decarboxylase-like PLP-dependent enzyme